MADLDGDGDLDAFVINGDQANRIYTNDGAGGFTADVISGDTGMNQSRGVALGDLDDDGDLDVFVVSGSYYASADVINRIYTNRINEGLGFTVAKAGAGTAMNYSRGVALGDLDGNDSLDAFVVNMQWRRRC